MLTLFIFKSNARGMQYGMGTYVRELTEALLATTSIKIYIVTYHNVEVKEFSIRTLNERHFEINIPSPKVPFSHNNTFDTRYAKAVVNLLSDTISKNEEIVFQMNYLDDLHVIRILKERYTHPVVSIVHFSQYDQLFNGNKQKMNCLNIDVPSNNEEFTIFSEKEMYRLSDHIVTINPFMRDFIIDKFGLPAAKLSLIRNGINFTRFLKITEEEKIKLRNSLGFNSYEKIILFSGRIDPDKGVYFLLDAFIAACKQRNDLRLVFIGQGKIQDLLQRCQLFLGKITFTGLLSQQKIKIFYQIANIGVVPSLYEPCSYSRLEMISNGIPLILPRIEGFSDMAEDEQCMFINPVFSPDGEISFNIEEFSKAILSLVDDNNLAESLAANAYRNLVNKYSALSMAKEMNSLFKTLIRSKKMNLENEKN